MKQLKKIFAVDQLLFELECFENVLETGFDPFCSIFILFRVPFKGNRLDFNNFLKIAIFDIFFISSKKVSLYSKRQKNSKSVEISTKKHI